MTPIRNLILFVLLASACTAVNDVAADVPPDSSTQTSALPPATSAPAATPTSTSTTPTTVVPVDPEPTVRLGVDVLIRSDFEPLQGLRVGLITNPVSTVDGVHLIDWLEATPNVELAAIFAAEHGIRGTLNGGELIDDDIDPATGIPIFSLYGDARQPTPEMLEGLDALVFDLQDVGTRYFTYTATMGLAMQSAAEAGIGFVVLDRPDPLGGELVEGFLRHDDQASFIAQYPVPSVHGLTAGELARMIKGQGWLPGLESLDLRVIAAQGWTRDQEWPDTGLGWIPPSPGLQTAAAALTYPATVLFEATSLSYGAGTEWAFQSVAAPWLDGNDLASKMNARGLSGVEFAAVSYVPRVIPNISFKPHYANEEIFGVRIIVTDQASFRPTAVGVHLLEEVLRIEPPPIEPELDEDDEPIGEPQPRVVINRPRVLDLLTGSTEVRASLELGIPAAEIVARWEAESAAFAERSLPYRLY